MKDQMKSCVLFIMLILAGSIFFAWNLPQKASPIYDEQCADASTEIENRNQLSSGSVVMVKEILSRNNAGTIALGQLRMAEQMGKTTVVYRNQLLLLLTVWFAWLLLPRIAALGRESRLLGYQMALRQNISYIHREDGKKRNPVAFL